MAATGFADTKKIRALELIVYCGLTMRLRPLCQDAINEVLDQKVRPLLSIDGAQVSVKKFDESTGTLQLEFSGRYRGCPGRQTVLTRLVRPILEAELEGLGAVKLVD
jgi:Fe-S cluster biogenesis protein NfuA